MLSGLDEDPLCRDSLNNVNDAREPQLDFLSTLGGAINYFGSKKKVDPEKIMQHRMNKL